MCAASNDDIFWTPKCLRKNFCTVFNSVQPTSRHNVPLYMLVVVYSINVQANCGNWNLIALFITAYHWSAYFHFPVCKISPSPPKTRLKLIIKEGVHMEDGEKLWRIILKSIMHSYAVNMGIVRNICPYLLLYFTSGL